MSDASVPRDVVASDPGCGVSVRRRKHEYSAPDLHDTKAGFLMSMTMNLHYARSPAPATPAQAPAKARVRPAAKKAQNKRVKSKPAKKK